MRKLHYPLFGLLVIFLITSSTIKPYESKHVFKKIVFIELNSEEDSVIFKPLSKAWGEYWWGISPDLMVNGSALMNYDKYKTSFNEREDNLWTVIHPMIIDGTIQVYFPYNPETFGFGSWDDGELRYPVTYPGENETFLSSETVRADICSLLGLFGPQSDIPLVDEYGDPIIIDLPDGTQCFSYPAPDFNWYTDKNISKYKLRVSVLLNKKGKEKKRVIKAICPIADQMRETGETYDKELFWLDFEELKPLLKETYYIDEDWKPRSYLDYFLQKLENAQFRKGNVTNSN